MALKEELQLLRIELRTLRQEVARFKHAWQLQKSRADCFEQENQELRVRFKLLEKENEQLKAKLALLPSEWVNSQLKLSERQ